MESSPVTFNRLITIHNKKVVLFAKRVCISEDLRSTVNVYEPLDAAMTKFTTRSTEYILLPIGEREFKNHFKDYTGYRFVFSSPNSVILAIPGVTDPPSVCVTVDFTVQRFKFRTRGANSIVVKKLYEPLFPPFTTELDTSVPKAFQIVTSFIENTVCEFANYYLNIQDI